MKTLLAFGAALIFCTATASGAPSATARYANVLRDFNPNLTSAQSQDMAAHVLLLAGYYSLDPRFLIAIVGVESNWRSAAVSRSGALGLGQLMPTTADSLSVLAFDAYENLDGTARYLRRLMQRYAGLSTDARYRLALASYNAGADAVARFGGIPPYRETQLYVQRVMSLWHRLEQQLPEAPAAPTFAVARVRAVPKVTPPPRPPGGSPAGFMALEVRTLDELPVVVAAGPSPDPPRAQARGLRGWLARALHTR